MGGYYCSDFRGIIMRASVNYFSQDKVQSLAFVHTVIDSPAVQIESS
jgi:hypothetical protein